MIFAYKTPILHPNYYIQHKILKLALLGLKNFVCIIFYINFIVQLKYWLDQLLNSPGVWHYCLIFFNPIYLHESVDLSLYKTCDVQQTTVRMEAFTCIMIILGKKKAL